MATVRILITDRPGGITCVVDSDPPIPSLSEGVPDVDNPEFTDAMAAGVFAAMQIHDSVGNSEWRGLIKGDPQ